jgi:hypothetical protein
VNELYDDDASDEEKIISLTEMCSSEENLEELMK